MTLRVSFSRHANEKVKERQIAERAVIAVLQNPQARFYDTVSRAEIAAGEMRLQGVTLCLVVVFRRRDDTHHVVTAYPVRDLGSEVERKVKSGRWIPVVRRG